MRKIIIIFSILFIILCSVSCTSNSASLSKEHFANLKEGDTFLDVKEIDKNAQIKYLNTYEAATSSSYASMSHKLYASFHQTKDGILRIIYITFCHNMTRTEVENYYEESAMMVAYMDWGVDPNETIPNHLDLPDFIIKD